MPQVPSNYQIINRHVIKEPTVRQQATWHMFGALTLLLGAAALGASQRAKADIPVSPFANTQIIWQTEVDDEPIPSRHIVHSITPHVDINKRNHLALALVMFGEGRNGGPESMRRIGHVVLNRVHDESGRFRGDIYSVIHQPDQFSCFLKTDINYPMLVDLKHKVSKLDPLSPDGIRWTQAKGLANILLSGNDPDPTDGALYYHTTNIKPAWLTEKYSYQVKDKQITKVRHLKRVAIFGGHYFYKPGKSIVVSITSLKDKRG